MTRSIEINFRGHHVICAFFSVWCIHSRVQVDLFTKPRTIKIFIGFSNCAWWCSLRQRRDYLIKQVLLQDNNETFINYNLKWALCPQILWCISGGQCSPCDNYQGSFDLNPFDIKNINAKAMPGSKLLIHLCDNIYCNILFSIIFCSEAERRKARGLKL